MKQEILEIAVILGALNEVNKMIREEKKSDRWDLLSDLYRAKRILVSQYNREIYKLTK